MTRKTEQELRREVDDLHEERAPDPGEAERKPWQARLGAPADADWFDLLEQALDDIDG